MSHHLHTDEPPTTFNFSQSLKAFNAVLRKSLLVIYYYLKEKKVIPQSFISKMSYELERLREKRALKTTASKKMKNKNLTKLNLLKELPSLINRRITGFKPLRGEINHAEPYNLLIC
jgi:NADH:ubiquinone oxidoreductase subunit